MQLILFLSILIVAMPTQATSVVSKHQPVPVILDTDLATDVDDVGAIAMLHALADLGEARILAIMHDTGYPDSVGVIAALNAYYGRPNIPIGAHKGGFVKDEAKPYVSAIAKAFASRPRTNTEVPAAAELYRQALAREPDQSVTIISIGFMTNLKDLLTSNGDSMSPLNGRELIMKKVKRMVVMGGGYPTRERPEFNFSHSGMGPTTKQVVDTWPTPILFSGFEIGESILTGRALERTPVNNPVRESYRIYYEGVVNDRWSWDQTAVLAAVRGAQPYWSESAPGFNAVDAHGGNIWQSARGGATHTYLISKQSASDVKATIDTLMTRPPQRPSWRR